MTDASTTHRIIIDRAPGQNRAMLLHGDTVVELLADYGHAPNRIGSIHRVRIDRVIADQNRAYASLDDGTSVSVRLGKSDQAEACLLYTSPSPRDRTRSRMPSSA